MRAKILLTNTSKRPVNYDYQYGLASVLYHRLAVANVHLANELHANHGFKPYTFSKLILLDKKYNKMGLEFEKAYFVISSPDSIFIKSFCEGLLIQPEFYLNGKYGKANMITDKIEILQEPDIGSECWFNTLSPLYVKTVRKEKEVDLYPSEPKFYENLHKNLVKRYVDFYDKKPKDYFEIVEVSEIKTKRVMIAGNYRRCSHLNMKILANPELLKFAYDAGLGEKNAMGFGCVDVRRE